MSGRYLRSAVVPPEMLAVLSTKETAKQAWDAVKTMRMGSATVHEAKAQGLRREFEDIRFKPGENVDDFAMRLTGLVNNLSIHGDPVGDARVVRKFLRVVPRKYAQVALFETLVDLDTLMWRSSPDGSRWRRNASTKTAEARTPVAF